MSLLHLPALAVLPVLLISEELIASLVISAVVLIAIAVTGVLVDRELRRRGKLASDNRRLYEDAEAARARAEELADELQHQAAFLEEQAVELEGTNQELEQTSARLRSVVNSALDAIVTIDAAGQIVDWNHGSEQIFGWSAEEAVGKDLADLIIPPRYREAHRRGLARYLETGEQRILNRRIEITGLRRDRSEFPVELTVAQARGGSDQVFSAFIRDISGEQLAARRMEAEHEVLRVLAESHSRDEAAPRVLETVGAALGWEVGVFWAVPEPGGEELRFVALWHSPTADDRGRKIAGAEIGFRRGEGLPGRVWESRRAQWIEEIGIDPNFPRAQKAILAGLKSAVAFPILHAGEVLGVIEFFNEDVVERESGLLEMIGALGIGIGQAMRRIAAEEERDHAMHRVEEANVELARRSVEAERARAQADEANRAKSDFLATMSHELRTPLNAILGYTDLLEMQIEGPLTPGQRAQLERIDASGHHLLMLIEDVLDLAKIEARRLGLEQRREAVEDATVAALALVEPQAAERGIEVENECLGSRVAFLGDGNRLRQILLNLLSNAVKFTEKGGRVTVRCGVAESLPRESAVEGRGPWSYVEVEDSGIGIAPQEMRAIFEPFVQADTGRTRSYGGTGLGLTISQRLARLMGGDITARSEEGEGSCFTVWLPAATEGQEPEQPAEDEVGPAALAQLGLLLQNEQPAILNAIVLRIRADPDIPLAAAMDDATLRDHQAAFLTDASQTLIAIAEPQRDPHVQRDGNDLRQLIASRHGVQRARLGWPPRAIEREYEILAEETEAAIRRCAAGTIPRAVLRRGEEILQRMVEEAGQTAAAVLRATGGQ
jgi:PAS domain S-box-containing protein